MTLPIQPISTVTSNTLSSINNNNSVQAAGNSFGQMLTNAIGGVNQAEVNANDQVKQLVNGNAQDLHNVTIALEKSDLMLKLAVNVRDKVVSAYQDVMRMQI